MREDLVTDLAIIGFIDAPPFFCLAAESPEVLGCWNVGVAHVRLHVEPFDAALSGGQRVPGEDLTISLGKPKQSVNVVLRVLRKNSPEDHKQRSLQATQRC